MDLSGVTEVAARITDLYQRIDSPTTFASLLSQAASGGGLDALPTAQASGIVGTGSAASGTADLTASYLLGQRLAGTTGGTAADGAGAGTGAAPAGWASALPQAGAPWAGAIQAAATNAGIDPRLLAAVTWAESGFNPAAVSGAGAQGLTQLMPATAAGLGVDPTDPVANLNGGAQYLADQLKRFGSLDLAVAAYNAGPGAVRQAGGIPNYPETEAYVQRVLGYYQQLGGTL